LVCFDVSVKATELKERPMTATDLTSRDRAILRAVAAGRCEITSGSLVVDGLHLADQFAAPRLARAGLIVAGTRAAELTSVGRALLNAA
jgi:hypothetical protein